MEIGRIDESPLGAELVIRCPRCGTSLREAIWRLEGNLYFRCQGCRATVRLEGDEIREAFRSLLDALRRFARALPSALERGEPLR